MHYLLPFSVLQSSLRKPIHVLEPYFPTSSSQFTGKKKRDVEAVVEQHAVDMMNFDQVEDIQELEDAIASANKFTGRNVQAKKVYGHYQK